MSMHLVCDLVDLRGFVGGVEPALTHGGEFRGVFGGEDLFHLLLVVARGLRRVDFL